MYFCDWPIKWIVDVFLSVISKVLSGNQYIDRETEYYL